MKVKKNIERVAFNRFHLLLNSLILPWRKGTETVEKMKTELARQQATLACKFCFFQCRS